jgi:hypothetical protein
VAKSEPFNGVDRSRSIRCQIAHVLEPLVADAARHQFNNAERRQMLIELLGSIFQMHHLRDEPDHPSILVGHVSLCDDDTFSHLSASTKHVR